VYCDGSGKGQYACVLEYEDESLIPYLGKTSGITNNEAEYRAILLAVSILHRGAEATIYSDSNVAINQLTMTWHTKNDKLRQLQQQILYLIARKELTITFEWIPRKENKAGKFLG
jgi:ribonuclease HI